MTATVVADGVADWLVLDFQKLAEQGAGFGCLKFRSFRECIVQSSDICGVVFAMMNFHRAGIEVWLKRIVGVGKLGQSWQGDF